MSHATHFLARLERLDESQVAFALSLYRNVPLVKELVAKAAPEGSGRVAIAVSPEPDGPRVVVARDGAFVTCLGAGMRTELPVISRAAVDKAARGHAELRERLRVTAELRRTPDWVGRAMRIYGGPRLSRESAEELMAWAPVLGSSFAQLASKDANLLLVALGRLCGREHLRPRDGVDVETVWTRMWATSHLVGPATGAQRRILASGDARIPPDFAAFYLRLCFTPYRFGTVMRGLWHAAHLGPENLPGLLAGMRNPEDIIEAWSAWLGVAALGLAEPSLRDHVRELLAVLPDNEFIDHREVPLHERLLDVLDHPEAALERHLAHGTRILSERIGDVGGLDASTLLAASGLDEELATGQFLELIDTLPFVAACPFSDLSLPQDVLRRLPPEDPDEAAWRFVRQRIIHVPRPQAKAPAAPGRNDPCSCGSGKKFKKCCGAGA